MARLLDATQPLSEDVYVLAGFPAPRLTLYARLGPGSLNDTRLDMVVHTGTHMDAPSHAIEGATSIDQVPLDVLVGPAVVWDVGGAEPRAIDVEELGARTPALQPGDALVLSTGWASRFDDHSSYSMHPWLTVEAAEWIVRRQVRILAVDTPTPDMPSSLRPPGFEYPVHTCLLSAGIPIVENLGDVSAARGRRVRLVALPIPLVGADGAPARVFLEY